MEKINLIYYVKEYFKDELMEESQLEKLELEEFDKEFEKEEKKLNNYKEKLRNILKRASVNLDFESKEDIRIVKNALFILKHQEEKKFNLRNINFESLIDLIELTFEKQNSEYKNYFKDLITEKVYRESREYKMYNQIIRQESQTCYVEYWRHENYFQLLDILFNLVNRFCKLLFQKFNDDHIEELEQIFFIKTEYAGKPYVNNKSFFKGYYSYLVGVYCSKIVPVYSKIYKNQILDQEQRYRGFDKEFYSLKEVACISNKNYDAVKEKFQKYEHLKIYKDDVKNRYFIPREDMFKVLFDLEAFSEKNANIKRKKDGEGKDPEALLDDRIQRYSRENNKAKLYNHIRKQQDIIFSGLEKTRKISDFNFQYIFIANMIAQIEKNMEGLYLSLTNNSNDSNLNILKKHIPIYPFKNKIDRDSIMKIGIEIINISRFLENEKEDLK